MLDERLNSAPCGYISLTDEGMIRTLNMTFLEMLGYQPDDSHYLEFENMISDSAKFFFKCYFFPLLRHEGEIHELYLSLRKKNGEELPVLVNAVRKEYLGSFRNECIIIPIVKRNEYEQDLLKAKLIAEEALFEKNKANTVLHAALKQLETKKQELTGLNKQNLEYKNRVQTELQLAKSIQENVLSQPIKTEHMHAETFYRPTSELSGDMYSFFKINDKKYGILILDVMDHGVSSALLTMSIRSLFEGLIARGKGAQEVVSELNCHLLSLFKDRQTIKHYCTLIYFQIDIENKCIEYINAGHPSAIWFGHDGKKVEFESLYPPIGLLESLTFESRLFKYKKGGRLFLFTDGITDSLSVNLICFFLKSNRDRTLLDIKRTLVEELDKNRKTSVKNDDQCFVLLEIN